MHIPYSALTGLSGIVTKGEQARLVEQSTARSWTKYYENLGRRLTPQENSKYQEMRRRLKESTLPGEWYKEGIQENWSEQDFQRFASRWGYNVASIRKATQQAESHRQQILNQLNPLSSVSRAPVSQETPMASRLPQFYVVRHTELKPVYNYLQTPYGRQVTAMAASRLFR